jgi:hypothetical protein
MLAIHQRFTADQTGKLMEYYAGLPASDANGLFTLARHIFADMGVDAANAPDIIRALDRIEKNYAFASPQERRAALAGLFGLFEGLSDNRLKRNLERSRKQKFNFKGFKDILSAA